MDFGGILSALGRALAPQYAQGAYSIGNMLAGGNGQKSPYQQGNIQQQPSILQQLMQSLMGGGSFLPNTPAGTALSPIGNLQIGGQTPTGETIYNQAGVNPGIGLLGQNPQTGANQTPTNPLLQQPTPPTPQLPTPGTPRPSPLPIVPNSNKNGTNAGDADIAGQQSSQYLQQALARAASQNTPPPPSGQQQGLQAVKSLPLDPYIQQITKEQQNITQNSPNNNIQQSAFQALSNNQPNNQPITPNLPSSATSSGLNRSLYNQVAYKIGQRESSDNYNDFNKYGYYGKYNMGPDSLADIGFIDPKAYQAAKSQGLSNTQIMQDPNNWTIPGGLQTYMGNHDLQEQSMRAVTNQNYNRLAQAGVIGPNTPPQVVAGLLAAAHLGGAGGAIKFARTQGGYNPQDAYGTSLQNYYNMFNS